MQFIITLVPVIINKLLQTNLIHSKENVVLHTHIHTYPIELGPTKLKELKTRSKRTLLLLSIPLTWVISWRDARYNKSFRYRSKCRIQAYPDIVWNIKVSYKWNMIESLLQQHILLFELYRCWVCRDGSATYYETTIQVQFYWDK